MFLEKVWQKQALHLPVVLVKKSLVFKKVSKSLKKVRFYMKSDGKNELFNVDVM